MPMAETHDTVVESVRSRLTPERVKSALATAHWTSPPPAMMVRADETSRVDARQHRPRVGVHLAQASMNAPRIASSVAALETSREAREARRGVAGEPRAVVVENAS